MSTRPKILICDDETGVRESLKLILSQDYDLDFAEGGQDALEKIAAISPDLVLLDIKMPKLHGLEILKQLKSARPGMPVIVVTGYQSVEIAQQAFRDGAADYIPKPFDSQKILKSVKNALGG